MSKRSRPKGTMSVEDYLAQARGDVDESQFRDQVVSLAKLLDWKVYFTWSSLHSPAGFPDLLLVRKDRVFAAELKVKNRKPTPAQQEWLQVLCDSGKVDTFVWRPENLVEIASLLQGRVAPDQALTRFKGVS